MNLNTLNNQFHINLPIDFVPEELEDRYIRYLKSKNKIYSTVKDYLDSTCKNITYPGMEFPTVSNEQNLSRKKIKWKTVGNVYDLFDKEMTITFNDVDSKTNYLIMQDILTNHYLNTDIAYDQNILVTVIDENRNALYHIQYRSVIWTGISPNTFSFGEQLVESKTFDLNFTYNYIDIQWVLDKTDIISNNKY